MEIAEEIIREIPKGLLRWYSFKKNSRVLYIGEEDCLLEWLKENFYCVESVCIQKTIEQEWSVENRGVFDYVIAIEALEKVIDPEKYLTVWKELLNEEGHLLLGMNNRLGLRYFCGDRDPYTERNFDGIENYRRAYLRKEDVFHGRCYSSYEIRKMLEKSNWQYMKQYSVWPDLKHPQLMFAEDYLPKEDLYSRLYPMYNYPNTIFLEEENLYSSLIENNMFHAMANAFFVECSKTKDICDVSQVTFTSERGRRESCMTIIHGQDMVEKKALFPEGEERIKSMVSITDNLRKNGVNVVDVKFEDHSLKMPYYHEKTAQCYLKELLRNDKEKFITEIDKLHDIIMKSSNIVEEDKGDGQGAVLEKGYLDMVPLNCFYVNGQYVFFDQEFEMDNCPANVVLARMIRALYCSNVEMEGMLSSHFFIKRYGLDKELDQWVKMECDFLADLRKEKELRKYHEKHRRNNEIINENRQSMNYSHSQYRHLFEDIFKNADTRKLILFGSGNFTKKFLACYKKDYPVYAILDNNKERWGQEIDGIKIQSPDILKELQSGEYKVIICIKNYLSVMKQLDELGVGDYSIYDWNIDYPRKIKPIIADSKTSQGVSKKYNIGYVAGAFDMFHVGHLNLLKRAKEMCNYLIVGVISDESIYRLKEKMPVIPCKERVEVVAGCRYVDQAEELPTDYAGIRDAYKMFHFDCQFSGDDHGEDEDWLADQEYLKKQGADIVFFPYTQSTSSTKIKEKISEDTMQTL